MTESSIENPDRFISELADQYFENEADLLKEIRTYYDYAHEKGYNSNLAMFIKLFIAFNLLILLGIIGMFTSSNVK